MGFKPQHDFFPLLVKHQVPFIIVGGHAVQFHGHTRNTEDVDVIWIRSEEAKNRLLSALQEANACWISNERDPKTNLEKLIPVTLSYINSTHLMMLWTDFGFVDIFDFVPGFPDADVLEVYQQSIPYGQFRFVSLDWLKKMKQQAGRHKDKSDLEEL